MLGFFARLGSERVVHGVNEEHSAVGEELFDLEDSVVDKVTAVPVLQVKAGVSGAKFQHLAILVNGQ